LGVADEAIEGTIDLPGGHPAGHLGGDFIADEDGSEAGVGVVLAEPGDEVAAGLFEEGGVFPDEVAAVAPGVGGDDDEVIFGGGVEESFVGEVVDADGVEAGGADFWEVERGGMWGVGWEGAVGDGAQEVRSSIEMEVLSLHGESHGGSLYRREGDLK
jgi:hypothetical protein